MCMGGCKCVVCMWGVCVVYVYMCIGYVYIQGVCM